MSHKLMSLLTICILFSFTTQAFAYIGPGLGVGAVGAVLGVVGGMLLALFAVLYYPIKRILKKRHKSSSTTANQSGSKQVEQEKS